jgi:tripartite-type tricarboxylate transporter receptor subunit TctC
MGGSRKPGLHRLGLCLLLAAAATLAAASPSTAETIKIVVPIPPGGSFDIVTRVLAEQIGRAHVATTVVENRPGADTMVGTELVARAAPDGKTLLSVGPGLVLNPLLHKTSYDPVTSFEPICQLVSVPTVITVSSKSPYLTFADLLRAARARPGQLTLASIGPASTAAMAFQALKRAAGIDMTFVPYSGTAPAFEALMGQHVTAYLGEASFVAAQGGAARVLAVASTRRVDPLPDVPTLEELGFRDVDGDPWLGLLAPARTPPATTARLAALFLDALRAPEVRARLAELGLRPIGTSGAEFATFIRRQSDAYARIVRDMGIRID